MVPCAFSGMVRVGLQPSRSLGLLLGASHFAAASSLLLLSWPRPLCWMVLASIGGSLVLGLRREAWRCSRSTIIRLDLEGGGRLCVFQKNGRRRQGIVMPGSFVAPFLVILRWRPERGGRRHYTVIARDAADPAAYRMLRVLLRHPL